METNAIGGASAATETKAKNHLGKDEFVRLLGAQLSNPDPTAPMESADFVAQLAQFANVELLQGVETRLDSLVIAQASSNQLAAAGLVGREVLYRTDRIELGESGANLVASLGAPATSLTVTISDEKGDTVRTLRLGAADQGKLEIPWDGRDENGVLLPAGSYRVRVAAADADGAPVPVNHFARGTARAISFDNGYAELLVGSARVKLSDIVELHSA